MGKRTCVASLALSAPVLLAILLAGCNGGPPSREPTPTEAPSASPTVTVEPTPTASPEEAVKEAYLHYWEVYGEALLNLDGSRLSEVMTGPRLERALQEIQQLEEQGRAVKIVVESRPVVVEVGSDEALVLDEYENRSYLIDAETKEPLSEPPTTGETIRDRVTLTRVGDTWKVLDTVRGCEFLFS
jgi:hypothetical protein